MPAKANTGTGNGATGTTGAKKNYNPTITALFDAPKFGMKDENGNGIEGTAFVSANIDAKAYDILQKHVVIGTKLLVRQSPRLNKNGGRTFYMEVLPPLAENTRSWGATPGVGRNPPANTDDGI